MLCSNCFLLHGSRARHCSPCPIQRARRCPPTGVTGCAISRPTPRSAAATTRGRFPPDPDDDGPAGTDTGRVVSVHYSS